jgi:hypothetical protein
MVGWLASIMSVRLMDPTGPFASSLSASSTVDHNCFSLDKGAEVVRADATPDRAFASTNYRYKPQRARRVVACQDPGHI